MCRTRLIESRQISNYHRCGRTDRGVSAFSQVISLDLRFITKHIQDCHMVIPGPVFAKEVVLLLTGDGVTGGVQNYPVSRSVKTSILIHPSIFFCLLFFSLNKFCPLTLNSIFLTKISVTKNCIKLCLEQTYPRETVYSPLKSTRATIQMLRY